MKRRDFLKTTAAGAGLALVGTSLLETGCIDINKRFDAKGLPTVLFGNTGVRIPRIVLGLGSRFCHIVSDSEAIEMLHFALDNGFYYWDTAHTYDNTIALPPGREKPTKLVISEERLGEVVKTRRKEIFLSTKIEARETDEAMKQIELSLKRLQTDRVDMLKIHSVNTIEDINKISKKGNLLDVLMQMKAEKVTRFIGFSCHSDPKVAREMAQRGPFDSMLIAMNHYPPVATRHEIAAKTALDKKMGLLMMKSVRPRETVEGLQTTDLIKYALSLEGPHAIAVGMDSIDVVKSNIEILRNFQTMPPEKMQELTAKLAPFYRHENLPWMQHDYRDGNWNS
ncbi:MAG: aldo/keto reductase [Tannerella sp.]|jgi:aryl-alcohol dehydrogenase-like predicted oxidoreductase|nr:aldo/keto reductase [Tannerella sp.]